jgi:hypothetical protein
MPKRDTFIVRSGRSGSFVTLPSGRRVHTLDRNTFERAIVAANNYISDSSGERRSVIQKADPTTPRERTRR